MESKMEEIKLQYVNQINTLIDSLVDIKYINKEQF